MGYATQGPNHPLRHEAAVQEAEENERQPQESPRLYSSHRESASASYSSRHISPAYESLPSPSMTEPGQVPTFIVVSSSDMEILSQPQWYERPTLPSCRPPRPMNNMGPWMPTTPQENLYPNLLHNSFSETMAPFGSRGFHESASYQKRGCSSKRPKGGSKARRHHPGDDLCYPNLSRLHSSMNHCDPYTTSSRRPNIR